MAKTRETGLLSFLFHIRHDEETRRQLHKDEKEAMEGFGLSPAVQRLIIEIGALAANGSCAPADVERSRQLWTQLLEEHLSAEIHADQGAIW